VFESIPQWSGTNLKYYSLEGRSKMGDDLKDLEMAKKRDHKIMITDEAINKVPRIQYKSIPEYEYDNIRELARSVLKISKDENDSNEVAVTYSLRSDKLIERGERYIGVALGGEHSVDPLSDTTAYHLVRSEDECVIIVLHNHPSLSDFSLTDVQFLLEYENVKMMVVVTNLGSISYLVKQSKYNQKEAVALFNKAVQKNNDAKDLKDLQDAADYFLKNSCNVGVCYDNR
jgi:proteasome lid subunit RPN8/RPN11